MKPRVYKVLPLLLVMAIAINSFAQKRKPGVFVGANFLYSVPQGSFAANYGKSPGAEVVAGIGLGKTFVQASYGTQRFLGQGATRDIVIKPLQLGLRQFLIGKKLFVSAEMGSATVRDKSKDTQFNQLTHRFGGGLRLLGLEAGVYYSGWNDNTARQSYQSVQYKLGWNLML